jgi:hypothetical protein
MKKLITIFLILFAAQSFAQYPAKQTIGSDSTLVQSKGALQGRIINWAYPDTTAANRERISQYPHAQIVVGNLIYLRDSTATKWVVAEKGASNISILNDSTLIISNLKGSDTFHTSVSINNWTILSDTTVRVCDGVGSCDTVYTAPTSFAKSYVDSVIIHNGANLDTLYYYGNGNAIVGGYIGGRYYNKDEIDSIFTVTLQSYYTQTQIDSINTANGVNNQSNHIISGGIVTWSGTGLTYYISACTYMIGGVVYNSPQATITLDPADATNPRIDLFAVDTLNEAIKITGTAAATPLTPQIDQNSQLGLTTGINLPPNATVPTGASSTLIYDENTEWTTGGTATVNFNNTANPYHGTKDAFVSAYSKNSTLTFSGTTQTVNGQTLRFFIDLLNVNYNFQLQFYNGSTAVSNNLALNGFGFNPTLFNSYQNVSIPLSSFSWSGTAFDKLVITMTGRGSSGTYYLDYISLEGGTPVITADYVQSVVNKNDSLFYVIKGVYYYSGFNAYQRSQTDSITAQLRTEIVSAAGGGVIAFNGRNGAVTSDSTDYNSFFYTKHLSDSLLALKLSAANLSLGTVTSTSQTINNSAGTGIILPSASITAAGLMTAGDKVLVNTIPLKVAYADTASMLSSYLRKTDAFTKTQADLLYKPISYVPTWTEITGKPTFATVATTGSYADLINKPTIPAAQIQSDWNQTNNTLLDYIKNKPTIPTNNNQLTNGAGYITSIDSSNFVKKTDSISVALLNGGKIDTSHLPTSTTVISHEGVGLWTIYASNSDTIHAKNLQAGTGVTLTNNADSSITISSTGSGSAIALQTNGVSNGSQSVLNLKNGTNTTITDDGSGGVTINSSGGGTTDDATITATAGQTSFTFSSVPASTNDYLIFINGNTTTNFTASGNTITLGMTDLLAGDKVRYKRIK